jgi:hypothetical protein
MADEIKKKANPAQKNELSSNNKNEAAPKDKNNSNADLPKTERGETVAASTSGYSRGEGQKPVSKAYKANWNAIYAKKKR